MDHPGPTDRLAELLDWIEQHLDEPLTVDVIADRTGLSPYHFSRLFSARMGRGVMAHVRGRRLVRGARRLLDEPRISLINLALDCGFESQEAFTRAFRRLFGVTPGRFRRGYAVTPIEGQFPVTMPDQIAASVARLPGLTTLDAFSVAGPAARFDDATKANIPQLWSRLIGALPIPGQTPTHATYGVVWDVDRATGSFDYMAGVRVEVDAQAPEGFTVKQLPPAAYAVFRITLNGGPVHPQVKGAMARIWGEMVPASSLRVIEGYDFEHYDDRFEPTTPGSWIDFHLPVEADPA